MGWVIIGQLHQYTTVKPEDIVYFLSLQCYLNVFYFGRTSIHQNKAFVSQVLRAQSVNYLVGLHYL